MTTIDPTSARRLAVKVVQQLRHADYEALWAGGCVRDELLGGTPKDYDVATSATPAQIRDLFGHDRTLPIGAAFGVITVLGPKHAGQVEVATFRTDGVYSDGRRPDQIEFSTAEYDAQRRDFTINGMFIDPLNSEVIDYVGGQEDLAAKVVRAIRDPHQRIEEDKLRMLRAVRFAATLEFTLEAKTLEAIQAHADQISQVSAERIAAELRRTFSHPNRGLGLRLLRESELLVQLFPSLAPVLDDSNWWEDTLRLLEGFRLPSLPLALAALFRDQYLQLGDEVIVELTQSLKLSRDESETVRHVLSHQAALREAGEHNWPRVQRILIQDRLEPLLDFADSLTNLTQQGVEGLSFCRDKMSLPDSEWNPAVLVDGGDLHRMGVHAGPIFREILDAVRDHQLNGELTNKEQAMAWLRSKFQV